MPHLSDGGGGVNIERIVPPSRARGAVAAEPGIGFTLQLSILIVALWPEY